MPIAMLPIVPMAVPIGQYHRKCCKVREARILATIEREGGGKWRKSQQKSVKNIKNQEKKAD
jgi:hypothetical protein